MGSGSPRHPCGVWRCGQGGFGLWVNLSLDGRAEGLNLCVCGGWQLLCHSFLPNELKLYFFQSCSRGQAQVVYLIISSFFFFPFPIELSCTAHSTLTNPESTKHEGQRCSGILFSLCGQAGCDQSPEPPVSRTRPCPVRGSFATNPWVTPSCRESYSSSSHRQISAHIQRPVWPPLSCCTPIPAIDLNTPPFFALEEGACFRGVSSRQPSTPGFGLGPCPALCHLKPPVTLSVVYAVFSFFPFERQCSLVLRARARGVHGGSGRSSREVPPLL